MIDVFHRGGREPSLAAMRVRRSRERRRRGSTLVNLTMTQRAIDDLVRLGWLAAADRDGKEAVTFGLIGLLRRAHELRVTAPAGEAGWVSFLCEVDMSTIQTLVRLHWLAADRRDDRDAVAEAFLRFASRALVTARNARA